MTSEKAFRKERKENQNIQVFVRLRPLNQREKDIKSLGVVEVINGREIVVRQSHQTLHTKKFTFDRAFPPHSKQVEVYQEVVSPLIEEVLAGYNCTVFAYGQTGTGKTHTMVGEAAADETTWQSDPLAGIIPRALSQLFDELRISNTEYTVRVSYLELYNEELFDLLSGSDDNSKLRIYEDVTRKGSNIVNGLEEITVYNKNEVYKIMAQGQERKKVASTLMNAQSSRSHTVFTIVVHMKENSPEGEELVKIGKLNLVDLAGSENISKAGSDNPAKRERARECVNINQSLLTLGRVITALVERHPHIPYRESKLTRILQESLGGRTKTSIIATISPGHKDVEETLSTLEYANRAKNIQNKPEINQKMTKKAILKEYAEEIDKLKKDLQAARDKNGIYLANETYAEMTFKQEEQKKEIQELLLKKRAMEEERDRMEAVFKELNDQLQNTEGKLHVTLNKLNSTQSKLSDTTSKLLSTEQQCSEQRHLVWYQLQKGRALGDEAQRLLAAADAAAADNNRLHDAVDKRRQVESRNLEMTRSYRSVSGQVRHNMQSRADSLVADVTRELADMQAALENYTTDSTQILSESKERLDTLIKNTMETIESLTKAKNDMYCSMDDTLSGQRDALTLLVRGSHQRVREVLAGFVEAVASCLQNAARTDVTGQLSKLLENWVSATHSQLQASQQSHGAAHSRAVSAAHRHAHAARRHRDAVAARAEARARQLQRVLQAITEDEEQNNKMLAENLAKVETEREIRERSLVQWMEKKRRLLQEEIDEFVQKKKMSVESEIEEQLRTEREYLEEIVKCNKNSIEEQKKLFEERTSRNIQWLKEILTENEREIETAEEELRENEKEADSCIQDLDVFTEKYKQESAVVSSSVDSLSEQVLSVAEQLKLQLVTELENSERNIKVQTEQLLAIGQSAAEEHEAGVGTALETVGARCRESVERLLGEVERCSSSTTLELGELSASCSRGQELLQVHRQSQQQAQASAHSSLEQFYGGLRELLRQHHELEDRCLHDEYAVYSPSGATPVRTRYQYPRALTAASPHQRVLQRYRATRPRPHADDDPQDCIVVEDETESRTSDCESSTSEDSMMAPSPPTAVPSPPTAVPSPPTGVPSLPAIVKCTSETDLYLRRKQQEQGKENAQVNRSMSFKKPSKLPAPATAKKPLVERNADH